MHREPVLLRTPFRQMRLYRRERAPAAEPRAVLSPGLLALELDAWFANRLTRKALLDFAGLGGRPQTDDVVEQARAWLERALERGHVVAVESRTRRVVLAPDGGAQSLGPEEPPPLGDDFLWALVFDSTGAPIADALGVTFDALQGGKAQFTSVRLRAGAGGIPALPQGAPPSYDLRFDVPDDVVPTEAAPVGAPAFERSTPSPKGPLETTVLVTRRELATKRHLASVGVNNVFQLARRGANVVEIEHFTKDSAVVLPGAAPADVYREDVTERPLGIDVLRACLQLAKGRRLEELLITGHHATLAQQRADAVRALLVGGDDSRTVWTGIALSTGNDEVLRNILAFTAREFSWSTDPKGRRLSAAIQELKIAYNKDVRRKLFPQVTPDFPLLEDGEIDPAAWGAIFDCYLRALHPVASPEPDWAKYPVGDEPTRMGANAGRPQGEHPFVVLGTNGPGNAPITIALYGSGSENNYMDLQPLNPQYAIGVDPEFVGQTLNVPDAWADRLADPTLPNGAYRVMRDPLTSDDGVPAEGAPALAAPGPRSVGCGARHLRTPFARAKRRRAIERHVEVCFLDRPDAEGVRASCGPGDGACTSARCELYDPRAFDLEYVTIRPRRTITLRVWLQDANRRRMPHAAYDLHIAGVRRSGVANAEGLVIEERVPSSPHATIEWGEHVEPPHPLRRFSRHLVIDPVGDDPTARAIHNLAYHGTPDESLVAFRSDYGSLGPPDIVDVHEHGTPQPEAT